MTEGFLLLQKSLEYSFMQKALLCGVFTAISSSLLGVFLVLRRLSLISDGLSHVTFATIALALLAGVNTVALSIPLVILASFAILALTERGNVYSDTAIGLISSVSVAAGVMIVSMGGGFNVDIYSYLFGSILSITQDEAILSTGIAILVVTVIILFYNEWFLISFDRDFAKTKGINIFINDLVFVVLQALVIVTGVKIVGAMLMSSLIIFPAVSSLQIVGRFKSMLIASVLMSVFSVICGIFISFVLNTPAGATIVCLNALVFLICLALNRILKLS